MKNLPCVLSVLTLLGLGMAEAVHGAIKLDAEQAVVLGGASLPPGRGVVTASEGSVADTAKRAFDGVNHTQWQIRINEGETGWIEYRFDDEMSWLLTEYTLTNGYAGGSRDPQEWELQGSVDGETWTTIDAKKRQYFAGRQSPKSIRVRPREAFNRFRFVFTGNSGGLIELAEVGLVVKAHVLPPIGVVAEAERGGMLVRWQPVDKATSYSVRRAEKREGPYTAVAAGVQDTRLMDGGPFGAHELTYYTVSAELAERTGPPSAPAGSATPASAPTDLRVKLGSGVAVLEWTPSPRAVAYVVKRSLVREGPYTPIASLVTAPAYTDEGLSAGTAYHYVVCGVANGKEGAETTPVSALFPPLAPTGLTAEPAKEGVVLKWNAVALAKSYRILRSESADRPKQEVAVVTGGTSYTDADLDFRKVYHYTVTAVNDCGSSAEATAVSASPIRPPSWWRR